MTNITPELNNLLIERHATPIPTRPSPETADEFLKEAYRINTHIHSLLQYLQSIRHSYLSITPTSSRRRRTLTSPSPDPTSVSSNSPKETTPLTDPDRDSIDTSTAALLQDLSTSLSNLSSAESLRLETQSTLLHKKYGKSAANLLFKWAGGAGALDDDANKPEGQVRDEEVARVTKMVRESVLWFLRRGLERAVEVQRGMVEKRIERVREKEKSVLYKNATSSSLGASSASFTPDHGVSQDVEPSMKGYDTMGENEAAAIEAQLSPQQLQLFAQENDVMIKHYEDTLSKVQNAEKSLLEISSLQQTLVSHLSTQEEYITQLVTDAETTSTNVGQGNKELKKASESRSTAQAVFWGTVGLCTGLVFWDLVF